MKHDYGNPKGGYSYEYINYFQSLIQMGHEVILFDFMSLTIAHGKNKMNQLLLDEVLFVKPDVAIFHLYTDQFDTDTINKLRKLTKTLSIFHDDTWRIDFTNYWVKYFDYSTTPDYFSYLDCQLNGFSNILFFPYGFSQITYARLNLKKKYDVSFIGRWHPYRQWIINHIRKAGISVNAVGPGWNSGMLDHNQMVALICQSKINLNISNSSSWDIRYLLTSFRGLLNNFRSKKTVEQIKGRHFEINGCGGFQLTNYVGGLENHYLIGHEIAVYGSPEDLIDKIKFYLKHDAIRDVIAKTGYLRTISDHTFARRFQEIFKLMGLENVSK
jgi:spore maturation protein CgeB